MSLTCLFLRTVSISPRQHIPADLEGKIALLRTQQRDARKSITLLQQPLKTLFYFLLVVRSQVAWLARLLLQKYKKWTLFVMTAMLAFTLGLLFENPLQEVRCNCRLSASVLLMRSRTTVADPLCLLIAHSYAPTPE